jgi:hypothetical protein
MFQTKPDDVPTKNLNNPAVKYIYYIRKTKQKAQLTMTNTTPKLKPNHPLYACDTSQILPHI